MKISTFGFKIKPFCQLDRIEEGFKELGYTVLNDNSEPDIIYCHDNSAEQDLAIYCKQKFSNAIYLQKILDIPEHLLPDRFNINKLKEKLKYADKILANSQTVKKQIKKYLDYNSIVVLDIPKTVFNRNKSFKDKSIDFLYGGRLRDSQKRGNLIKELEENAHKFCVTFGGEWVGNKNHAGTISDTQLSELYSFSKFVLSMGQNEGIGMLTIEGFLSGSFPLVASDQNTRNEFAPKEFHTEPTWQGIIEKSKEIESNLNFYQKLAEDWSKELAIKFHPHQVCKNILNAANPF